MIKKICVRALNSNYMKKKYIILYYLFFILFLIVYIKTIDSYSICWDEYAYFKYSRLSFDWFLSGKKIFSKENIDYYISQNSEHPMGAKFIYGIFYFITSKLHSGNAGVLPYRAGNIFFLFLIWYYFYNFAILFKIKNILLFLTAPFLLILLPCFFPMIFFCALDFPVAAAIFVMFYYFCNYLLFENQSSAVDKIEFKKNENLNALKFILSICFASVIKLNGIIMGIFLIILSGLLARKKFVNLIKYILLIPIIYFILNPYFWHNPLIITKQYINFFRIHHSAPYFYLGKIYGNLLYGHTPAPPVHFPFYFFFFTAPISLIIMMIVSLFVCIKYFFKIQNDSVKKNFIKFILTSVSVILFSILLVAMPQKAKYDSTRLFLQIYPILILIIVYLLDKLKSRIIIILLIMSSIAEMMYIDIKYHPAQLSYFNILTGGTEKVWNNGTQITYYGESLKKESINELNKIIKEASIVKVVGYNSLCFQLMKQLGLFNTDIIFYFENSEEADNYFICKYFNFNQKYLDDLKFTIEKKPVINYFLLYNSTGVLNKSNYDYLLKQRPIWSQKIDNVILFALYENKY